MYNVFSFMFLTTRGPCFTAFSRGILVNPNSWQKPPSARWIRQAMRWVTWADDSHSYCSIYPKPNLNSSTGQSDTDMSLKTSASMPSLVSCADREVTTPHRTLHLRLISNSSAFRKVRSETDLHKLEKHKQGQFYSDSPANRKLAIKSKHKYNERDRVVEGEADVNPTRMGGFGVTGGNGGHSNNNSNNNNNNNNGDRDRDAYYQTMLKAHPGDPLLLRNYARFLHQVKHQAEKAEEYYERAVLANPGDGDVLAMYAKLLWEVRNDPQRAQMYFDRAVQAAPDDCYVLASHAHFLWNTEEEEEAEEEKHRVPKQHFSTFSYRPSSAAVYS